MIDSILKWYNLICCLISLAAYIYIPQEDSTLGILAIMEFLVFRYFDDKIIKKRENENTKQRDDD